MRIKIHQGIATVSTRFVRQYLTIICLIICLIILSVFWGFNFKARTLVKDQLIRQGQAFFKEVVLTREWISRHGGVFVKLKPGMEVNPYLMKVPGLKVVIKDEDGETYILKNPALVTREISELAAAKGLFQFRITSLKPLNPNNSPDGFETTALKSFEQGGKEFYLFDRSGSEVFFRYMAPLITDQTCLRCHAAQGYRAGDVRGGISVTIPATDILRQIGDNQIYLTISAIGIVVLILAIIYLISNAFIKDLKNAEQKLVEMAIKDPLTGLLNRREALNRLKEEIARAERYGTPLSLILIDIDHFKQVNDTYGHGAGDQVLMELARIMPITLREYDIICRYGGEEFLVVTPETSIDTTREVAERLRCTIEDLELELDADTRIGVTISCGVSALRKDESLERFITRADEALYRAKSEGRNRVAAD
jgi:diguanylate cyclase (GGDEF)-like protein